MSSDPSASVSLTDPEPGQAFVHVCTIQRMAINVLGRSAVSSGDGDVAEGGATISVRAFGGWH